MASENKICNTTITSDGVTLQFLDGTTIQCSIDQLPESVVTQSALFGLRRKLTNSFADVKGDVDKAIKAANETLQQLMQGLWTAPREAAEGVSRTASDLVEAVMAITGKARDVVEEKLDGLEKEGRAALRKNPQVAAKLLEIRAERAKAKAGEPADLGSIFG